MRRKEINSQLQMSTSSIPNGGSSSELGFQNTIRKSHLMGLVIDGRTLDFALEEDVRDSFLELAKMCHSVVCCRTAPIQKVHAC
jgi:magnesium-transporting ATPase (P-type)